MDRDEAPRYGESGGEVVRRAGVVKVEGHMGLALPGDGLSDVDRAVGRGEWVEQNKLEVRWFCRDGRVGTGRLRNTTQMHR